MIPGLSLSILRQETTTQSGQPVLISGRFTAFGIGFPVLIRVTLEGPDYNPERTTFDTFASFTGDYNIQIVAPKDGNYKVYSQAYLPPPIPQGPAFPTNIFLLPAIAESEQPPLVVGVPAPGGVSAQLPDGIQFLPAPAPSPVEVQVTVGAPSISVTTAPSVAGGLVSLPYAPSPMGPVPVGPVPQVIKNAVIDDARIYPDTVTLGQMANGFAKWRNVGADTANFNVLFTLVSQNGIAYGPLQKVSGVRAFPGNPVTTPALLNTTYIPAGDYDITVELEDPSTGAIVSARTFSYRLHIVAPAEPVPLVPLPPTPPDYPTASMLGTPVLNAPSEVTI